LLVAGRWSLVAGHWSLVAGRWLLWSLVAVVAGRWSLLTSFTFVVACACAQFGDFHRRYVLTGKTCDSVNSYVFLECDASWGCLQHILERPTWFHVHNVQHWDVTNFWYIFVPCF
jgi:hypothetical protein